MDTSPRAPGGRGTAVAFDARLDGLTGIAVKGFLLSLVTFGIYRFWYMTNLRRFFWSRTLVDGSPAEYTGSGKELFLGFLVALAILVPVYVGLFAVSLLSPSLAPFSAPISFLVLFLLGQYALYRGRRYRAMRTLWRGIRLGQDGSGLAFAARAAGWWLLTLLTLGLAFPFMRAGLERYRIRHTLIGVERMGSTARGRTILGPWLLIYAVALLPPLALGLAFLAAADFAPPTDLFVSKGGKGATGINPDYDGTTLGLLLVGFFGALATCLPLALLLVPFYRARETRAFMNAASLGDVRLVSTLRARQFYWPYLVYALSLIGFVALLGLIVALLAFAVRSGAGTGGMSILHLVIVPLYLGGALVFAVLYVRVIQARLWAAVANTTTVSDAEGLGRILAAARGPGSGLQEGLADSLDVGGALQIGF